MLCVDPLCIDRVKLVMGGGGGLATHPWAESAVFEGSLSGLVVIVAG